MHTYITAISPHQPGLDMIIIAALALAIIPALSFARIVAPAVEAIINR